MDAHRNLPRQRAERALPAAGLEEQALGDHFDQIDALAGRENRGRQLRMPRQADTVRHQLPQPPHPPPQPPPPHDEPHDEPDDEPHDEPPYDPQELRDRGCGLRNSVSVDTAPAGTDVAPKTAARSAKSLPPVPGV